MKLAGLRTVGECFQTPKLLQVLIDKFLASSLLGVAERSGVEVEDLKLMSGTEFKEHLSNLGYNKAWQAKLAKMHKEL